MSVFDHLSLAEMYDEVRSVYQSMQREWMVAFSGGKDSRATLQLIWQALSALPPQERRYRIHIILNDTLVEDPAMAALTHLSLTRINAAAQAEARAVHRRFPGQQAEVSPLFQAHRLCPPVQQRFWFLLLGLGYPAPTVKTRWCVDRLKLAPAETFIREHISR